MKLTKKEKYELECLIEAELMKGGCDVNGELDWYFKTMRNILKKVEKIKVVEK